MRYLFLSLFFLSGLTATAQDDFEEFLDGNFRAFHIGFSLYSSNVESSRPGLRVSEKFNINYPSLQVFSTIDNSNTEQWKTRILYDHYLGEDAFIILNHLVFYDTFHLDDNFPHYKILLNNLLSSDFFGNLRLGKNFIANDRLLAAGGLILADFRYYTGNINDNNSSDVEGTAVENGTYYTSGPWLRFDIKLLEDIALSFESQFAIPFYARIDKAGKGRFQRNPYFGINNIQLLHRSGIFVRSSIWNIYRKTEIISYKKNVFEFGILFKR